MNIIFKIIFLIFFFFPTFSFTKDIFFEGLNRISIDDLNLLTEIDISKGNFDESEINQIIKDLYKSDLIETVNLLENVDRYLITISETKIIENIYINGNIQFKDDDLIKLFNSKKNNLLSKKNIDLDSKLIKNLYSTKGFDDTNITVQTERYSDNKVNLIFSVIEGKSYKLTNVIFNGNNSFSSKILSSQIQSKPINFYNILSSGSNINSSLFENDLKLLKDFYLKKGFGLIEITYSLNKNYFNSYVLNFYINENDRSVINDISFNISSEISSLGEFSQLKNKFEKQIDNNNNYYDYDIINNFINDISILNDKKNINKDLNFKLYNVSNNSVSIEIYDTSSDIIIVKNIDLIGNTITKSNVLLNKITIQPGDYLSNNKLKVSKDNLTKSSYINNVNYNITKSNDGADIVFEIDENKKTGNFLLGASFNGDVGAGVVLSIEDSNLFGTGNKLDGSFRINSERIQFDLTYLKDSISNPNIKNEYILVNNELNYQDSFGFKSDQQIIGYNAILKLDEETSLSSGFNFSNRLGHSAVKSNDTSISDNIGSFQDFNFKLSITRDNTNNSLYPTKGYLNSLSIEYSPEGLSDNSYIKANYLNDNYFNFGLNDDYLFLSNRFGFADALNSNKLKTINSFSLGGINFKGFDYKGIGPRSVNNVYLGGNQFFTSTIGYGSSFLFDKKDNVNVKLFLTTGSLWDSDYIDNKIKLRSSVGTSLDFLTPVGPISFSYSIPIEKENSDRTRAFDFTLGTAF